MRRIERRENSGVARQHRGHCGRPWRPHQGVWFDVANGNAVYAFARTGNDVFDLTVGPDGALYALTRGTTFLVYRYQYELVEGLRLG